MPIYDLDTLPPQLRPQLAAFGASDGHSPQDYRFLRRLQRLGHPSSIYFGVYAVDRDRVLARIETLYLPFQGYQGSQPVAGISDVLTRPDGLGRGYAGRLLGEVHRRALADGRAWSFLWTQRSWGAHRVYERLGYEDVYSPPFALRAVPRSARQSRSGGYSWSVVNAGDAGRLEQLLDDSNRGRLGFVPRSRGAARLRFRLGWRTPKNHRILWHGNQPVGYANLSDIDGFSLTTNEVVIVSPEFRDPMLRSLERLAAGRWLAFLWTSFVHDASDLLARSGYQLHATSHSVLMAKRLETGTRGHEDLRKVFRRPEFSCHRGDMF